MIRKSLFLTVALISMMACNGNAKKTAETGETGTNQESTQTQSAEAVKASIEVGSKWHDGLEWFQVRKDGDVLVFFGGTLHEGGSVFGLKANGNNRYKVVPALWENDPEMEAEASVSARGMLGLEPNDLTAELKAFDGKPVIVIKHKTLGVRSVLLSTDDGMKALDASMQASMAQWMSGNWQSADGKRYTLKADQSYSFPSGSGKYKFEYVYDTPYNVITLNDGSHWSVEAAKGKLTLTEVKQDSQDEELWEPMNGGKTISLSLSPEDQQQWRYGFASTQPLTVGMIEGYDKEDLRIMRNEIWARHGYKFNSPDLQQRFSKVKGYKPVADNNQVHLTPLEQLNAETIKAVEERTEEW